MMETGKQLGIALDRFHNETEERKQLVQRERNMLANELHDSLAQTMASLRFQVRILDEMLQRTSEYKAINSIEQVEQGLDEAYTDLRELIAHCRRNVASHKVPRQLIIVETLPRNSNGKVIKAQLQAMMQHEPS